MKIILAGRYPEGTFERLKEMLPGRGYELEAADTPEKYNQTEDGDILILRIFKASEEVMVRNRNLKMILRWGTGYDSVDLEAAKKRGILVTNTPGANASAVAELAVLMMLSVGRKILCHQECLQRGEWSKNTYLDHSFTLNHKNVGIIGAGAIGRQVAALVQAFGAKARYYDLHRLTKDRETACGMEYLPLDRLLAESDLLSLHVPLTEGSRHLIGKKQIAAMKRGAILINTARGGLMDDEGVLKAVEEGRLAGAGIDCVEDEPLNAGAPLLHNPNIIVTPHVGGGTADLAEVIIPMLVKDITDYAAGRQVEHTVVPGVLA